MVAQVKPVSLQCTIRKRKRILTKNLEPLLSAVKDLSVFSLPSPKQESFSTSSSLNEDITMPNFLSVTSAGINQEMFKVCDSSSLTSYTDQSHQTQLMAKTVTISPTMSTSMSESSSATPFQIVAKAACNQKNQAVIASAVTPIPPLRPIGAQVPWRVPLAAWSVHDVQRLLARCGFAEAGNAALECGLDGKTLLGMLCSDDGKQMLALPVRDGGLGLMGMRMWRVVSELRGAEAIE